MLQKRKINPMRKFPSLHPTVPCAISQVKSKKNFFQKIYSTFNLHQYSGDFAARN